MYYTHSGLLIATDSTRLVVGGRGAYLEFEPHHIIHDNIHIPQDQLWRLSEKYRDNVFYHEYRSKDDCCIMIYFQQKYVGYADYNPGCYYIAPSDLSTENHHEYKTT